MNRLAAWRLLTNRYEQTIRDSVTVVSVAVAKVCQLKQHAKSSG